MFLEWYDNYLFIWKSSFIEIMFCIFKFYRNFSGNFIEELGLGGKLSSDPMTF